MWGHALAVCVRGKKEMYVSAKETLEKERECSRRREKTEVRETACDVLGKRERGEERSEARLR